MNISEHYGFNLPSYSDTADIEKISDNFKTADKEMYRQKLIDDNLQRDKVENTAFNAHKVASILDHLDNSVTDAKIGERSIGTSKGMLQALLDAIGNAIKAITGNATWSELPAVTLVKTKLHIDSKENPHGTTKAQVGLGNADNTNDINKPVSAAQAAAIKTVQDDVTAHKANAQNPHSTTAEQVGTYTKAVVDAKNKAINDAATAHYNDNDRHINSGERPKWNDKYTKSEVDNKFSMLETNTDWKESVATFADIAKIYPTPQDGWTVNTRDTDYTYRYSGTNWVVISANAIPKATASIDGLQTKENVAEVNANTANRHNHNNKSVLDVITNVLINTWNTVTEKLNLSGGTLTGFLTLHAAPTANMHAANKKYVDDIAGGKGNGDMLKTVYDKNNDGVVDNAAAVGGKNIELLFKDNGFMGNVDWNNLMSIGTYGIAQKIPFSASLNQPVGAYLYGVLLIVRSITFGITQVYFPHTTGGVGSEMYWRTGWANGNFVAWRKVTDANTLDGLDSSAFCLTGDSRLTNERPASDVYPWAKQSAKPSYNASEVDALPINGTAVAANSIDGGTY